MLDECGEVGAFTLGPREVVVVASAELARAVLVDQADAFEKGPVVRRFARPVLGDGLIPVANARHRERRKIVAQGFGPRALDAYAHVMADVAAQTVSAWEDGAVIDVGEEMARLALRVVGRTLFSVDLGPEQPELSEAFGVVLRWVTSQIDRPIPLPLSFPVAGHPRVRRALATLNDAMYALVRERRAHARDDLLGLMVRARDEAGRGLTDEQLRDEAMNLFLAGHETSANALTWTLDLLMRNRSAHSRVADEARAVLGERVPTADDVPKLSFTGRVFEEALRLYPPVHSLGRQAARAVQIGQWALRKGVIVIVSPLLMHRRAQYFDRPEAFEPDRFVDARAPKFAYLPFGAGPRACLGGQFATLEAVIAISTIARAVDLHLLDVTPNAPELLVTLRPSRPVRARVARRA